MPGNAGGAKGPDFWCAFEDGEVVVIGDEPANTNNDRRRRRLLCRGAKESYAPCRSRVRLVCLRVPCGEASRKAGCRKSARPVTEMARCALTYNLTRVLNIVGVEPLVRYLRNDLKAARTSSENSFGSSQAAKCPPRSTSLK